MVDRNSAGQRYELTRRLATGGMAEVFLAKAYGPHGFEKHLALKRILPELAAHQDFERRFIDEARLAVALSHANIVQVLDFGRMGGALYIALEYVDGAELGKLATACRLAAEPLSVANVLHAAIEILKGLAHAHRQGVIHRDISPSNILVSRGGEVKVADFGIAVIEERPAGGASQREVAGKLGFMAPEQRAGGIVDARSDLYSVAVVLHDVLYGIRPPDAPTVTGRGPPFVAPTYVNAGTANVPPELDAVIKRGLEPDPGKRWQTAEDFLRALVEIAYSQKLVTTGLELAERVSRHFPPANKEMKSPLRLDGFFAPRTNTGAGKRHTAPAIADGNGDGNTIFIKRTDQDGSTVLELETDIAPTPEKRRGLKGWTLVGGALVLGLVIVSGVLYRGHAQPERAAPPVIAPAIVSPPSLGLSPTSVPVPSAAPAHTTRLEIRTKPSGATVELDGKLLGQTPLSADVPFDETAHQLRLKRAGYRDLSQSLELKAKSTRVEQTLESSIRYGTIDLFTEPWALVFLNDKKIAEAPVRGLRLPVGQHRLRLVNPMLQKETVLTVTVPHAQPYSVHLR